MSTIRIVASLIALTGILSGFVSIGAAEEIPVLIVHPDIAVDALTRTEVKKIFLGNKSRWPDNQRIQFVTLKNGAAHDAFVREYVEKTPSQFTIYWKKMVFTGRGRIPPTLAGPEAVVDFVARTPGAVGYVPESTADETVKIVGVP